ncbi:transposase [Neorhizobium sp. DAR64861/K0K2]|uniref:transposase n=1 Tax=unclassified Neorhizobium TaxID=2629175 RepID=UPI003D294C92
MQQFASLAPAVLSDSNRWMSKSPDRRNNLGDPVPHILRQWLSPFRVWFTTPSWDHLLVLVMGAILSPGKRTVTACLRITGRAEASNFAAYHQLLNRARWNPRLLSARLLSVIVERLVPDGPVLIGMDDNRTTLGPTHRRTWNLS